MDIDTKFSSLCAKELELWPNFDIWGQREPYVSYLVYFCLRRGEKG